MMKKLIYDKINIKPCYGLLDVPENFPFNNFNKHWKLAGRWLRVSWLQLSGICICSWICNFCFLSSADSYTEYLAMELSESCPARDRDLDCTSPICPNQEDSDLARATTCSFWTTSWVVTCMVIHIFIFLSHMQHLLLCPKPWKGCDYSENWPCKTSWDLRM